LVVRKLAGIALAAGVLVSVAGCSFNPHPESLQSYAPSDGVGADLTKFSARNTSVAFRNFLIVTDGTTRDLYGTVVNSSNHGTLNISIKTLGHVETIAVKAGQTFVYGPQNFTALPLTGKAGDTVSFYVSADGSSEVAKMSVPVVDNTIDYYSNAVVTPTPVATN